MECNHTRHLFDGATKLEETNIPKKKKKKEIKGSELKEGQGTPTVV